MSDYLWDKTGEPEEDVAQLEQLLGTLKYKPRPLEIPASAMPRAEAMRLRTADIFSRPRLALAASLLLTLLAGAWFITPQDAPQKNQIAEAKQGSQTGQSSQPETAVVANAGTERDKDSAAVNIEQTKSRRHTRSRENRSAVGAVSNSQRASRQLTAKRPKLTPRVGDDSAATRELVAEGGAMRWQVEQPMTPQQREATEKLMFALRLASAKLNYAQREMQEIGRAGK